MAITKIKQEVPEIDNDTQLIVGPKMVLKVLVCMTLTLTMLDFAIILIKNTTSHGRLLGLGELFYMGHETNIPAWYSTIILLICSILLALIASKERSHASKWKALSFIFLYMSADEAAAIHERLGTALELLSGSVLFAQYGWVIPGIIVVAAVVLILARFVFTLPSPILRLFILAAVLYVGGASGMEAVGINWGKVHGSNNFVYPMMTTGEEFMEMIGIVVFIYALMMYIADYLPNGLVTLKFSDTKKPSKVL